MKKQLLISSFLLLSAYANALELTATVNNMIMVPEGMALSLSSTPSGCTSNINGYTAVIKITNPNYSQMLSLAFIARTTNKPVKLTYNSLGNCSQSFNFAEVLTLQ